VTISVTHSDTAVETDENQGIGALRTERGNLPLHAVDVDAAITGISADVGVTQTFHNPFDVPLEATYVFPLPDRAAVTAMTMTAADGTVQAELAERAEARRTYDRALREGRRAAIAEEERADVFTLRVGNIAPGEEVTVELRTAQPLAITSGEAEFRFPFVVAPRYIPGDPLEGPPTGGGTVPDTDAVSDASRISPPVLLPGFPNPVALSLTARIDPAGLPLRELTSSLHVVETDSDDQAAGQGVTTVRLHPGERLDRDFVLRFALAEQEAVAASARLAPDAAHDGASNTPGTLTCVLAPPQTAAAPRPRDVVILLDRSGSMRGWKMVAARRAAARIVDTLTDSDTFCVLAFDHHVEAPPTLGASLAPATDRNRFAAVTHLAAIQARGGTEMLAPLRSAARMLAGADERDRVLVLLTDGQVGDEDRILAALAQEAPSARVHAVGVDRAVNAGFLNRLAAQGRGRCELVESEERLDAAMHAIHARIGVPVLTGVEISAEGVELDDASLVPASGQSVFPEAPLTLRARYRSVDSPSLPRVLLRATTADGERWEKAVQPEVRPDPAAAALWARARLRSLEDRYAAGSHTPGLDRGDLERAIIDTSLRFGVLCRFTAFVAVDTRVSTEGGPEHRVVQPVEQPSGWEPAPPGGAAPVGQHPAQDGMDWMGGPQESLAMPLAGGSYERAPAPGAVPRTPPRPGSPEAREGRHGAAGPVDPAARRDAGRPKQARPGPPQASVRAPSPGPEADSAWSIREELSAEARRMHQVAEARSPWEQRMYLADLATRLEVYLDRLRAAGAQGEELTDLADLVPRLHACARADGPRGAEVERLWTETLQSLEHAAQG
jgi:Ca-activated chloride channel homolog